MGSNSTLFEAMIFGTQHVKQCALSHLCSCSGTARNRCTCPAACTRLTVPMRSCLPPVRLHSL